MIERIICIVTEKIFLKYFGCLKKLIFDINPYEKSHEFKNKGGKNGIPFVAVKMLIVKISAVNCDQNKCFHKFP
jgi:hypothetical protein